MRLAELAYEAVRFAYWAAGEGICPIEGEPARSPEDIFYEYAVASGDEDWEGVAAKVRAIVSLAEPLAQQKGAAPEDGEK